MVSPLISVTLPTYNPVEAHFRAAIESVLSQTFRDFELLIVDDASAHEGRVEAIVASYNDPRIRFFRNPTNKGIAGTRNVLHEMAQGAYIAVMDHDDLCLPERFEKQVAFLQAHPEIGLCGTAHKRFGRLFKNNSIHYPQEDEEIRAGLFFKCIIHHPSVMLRKSVMDEHGIRYDETMVSVNDRALYKAIGERAGLHNLDDVLCLYRLHAGMTSRTHKERISQEQRRLRDIYLRSLGAELTDAQKEILNAYVLRGRGKIKTAQTLAAVEEVLALLCRANAASGYLPKGPFERQSARYLIKRCVNAMGHGKVGSGALLRRTELPVAAVGVPWFLRVFNALKKGS